MTAAVHVLEPAQNTKGSVAPEPFTGAVTRERYERCVEALREYKSNTGATWAEIAKALGPTRSASGLGHDHYTESTLSVFASGKYALESARYIVDRVEQFLILVGERRALVTRTPFVATSVSKRIFALIKQCVLLTKMGVAACESGTGKTRTLDEWNANHPNSTIIRANRLFAPSSASSRAVSSPAPTLEKIAKAIGCYEVSRNKAFIYDAVVGTLSGSDRVLIIDQAQFLPSEALELLTSLHEDADIPIILGGWAALYDRGPRDYESAIAYRSRTLRVKITTSQIRQSDVDLVASEIVGVDVARDASRVLQQQAQASGGFRRLVNILQVAQTYRNGDEPVTKAHVLRAIDERPEDGGGL